jgi:cell division protein ZapB
MANDSPDQNEPLMTVDNADDETPASAIASLALLAERVEQLTQLCQRLARENHLLRQQQTALQTERDSLREKHQQSRARIDAMVVRLKGLGHSV